MTEPTIRCTVPKGQTIAYTPEGAETYKLVTGPATPRIPESQALDLLTAGVVTRAPTA